MLQNEWRSRAIFATVLFVLASLFLSRALLSISTILFIVVTIVTASPSATLKRFLQTPYLWSITLLFFIPLVSGLWSSNTNEWSAIIRVKLPFLLLPFAFAADWRLSEKQWRYTWFSLLVLVIIACIFSTWQYFQDFDAINESYLRAKTIPTPLGDDHVRFSSLVSVAIATACVMLLTTTKRKTILFLIAIILVFLIYLHILSARTGLLQAYFFLICFITYLAIKRKPQVLTWLIALIVVIAACWAFIPTLQNRIRYNRYDFSLLHATNPHPGTSDVNRLLSIQAGLHILESNPFGVGAGDVKPAMNEWYSLHYPDIKEQDKLYPSSEWLVYGTHAGWLAIIFFTIIVFLPLFIRNIRFRFAWIIIQLIAIAGFLIETGLETQYGIFIYCFLSLCWWKWLKPQNE